MATKEKGKSIGHSVRDTYWQAKSGAQQYAAQVKRAYKAGYVSGWKDREKVPMSFGCRRSAMIGYGRGLSDHGKVIESQERFQRRQ